MSLRLKLILILCLVFIVNGGLSYIVQQWAVMPSFLALEREQIHRNVDRVLQAIERELEQISRHAGDWAYWDDVYAFIQDGNHAFVEKNLSLASIREINLNVFYFFNQQGQLVWGRVYDLPGGEDQRLDILPKRGLSPDHPLLQRAIRDPALQGIVQTDRGPLLIVAKPILTSERQGPGQGTLIAGRFLNATLTRQLAEQTRLDLRVHPVNGSLPAALHGIFQQLQHRPAQIAQINAGNGTAHGYRLLADLYGEPALLLEVDAPREISLRGEQAIQVALWSFGGASLIVLLALWILLQITVIGPLLELTRHAVSVGQNHELTLPLPTTRRDEIGILSREFHRMLERLRLIREKLLEQSFYAGVAEMASGVLHNLGNALTPLKARIDTLEQALRHAPAPDLIQALQELSSGAPAPERRADLQRFAELAALELRQTLQRCQEQSEALNRQLQHVQEILADQHQRSRALPVVEPVHLRELLEEAIALLSPTLRARLNIDIDPGVATLPPARASRIALLQALGNLFINAAEAVPDGRQTVRLQIRANLETAAGQSMLNLLFTDDGVGMTPDQLEKLFQRGFSTKARSSGLGLHWCANALIALGGRMEADSLGPGQGACFQIQLPATERRDD